MHYWADSKEWIMYHGTSLSAARQIKAGGEHGLQPSTKGMLGPGVYCSRDITKARNYAYHSEGGVIFELRVKPGKVKAIRSIPHPLQHSWHAQGYDTAWVPPGVNPNKHEEDCVWDPQRVRIVGVAWSDCGFTWQTHRPVAAGGGGGYKPQCWYGSSCYRKNPEHLAKYRH